MSDDPLAQALRALLHARLSARSGAAAAEDIPAAAAEAITLTREMEHARQWLGPHDAPGNFVKTLSCGAVAKP